jgi:hypothetical protein
MDFNELDAACEVSPADFEDLFSEAPPVKAPAPAIAPLPHPSNGRPVPMSSIGVPLDLYIRGRGTFDVKDELKLIGCRWDSNAKAWYALDPKMAADARDLVKRGPQQIPGQPAVPVSVHDLSKIPVHDLVRELYRRGPLTNSFGPQPLIRALRLAGYRVQEEAGDSLADIVAAEAPTLDELTDELEKLENIVVTW